MLEECLVLRRGLGDRIEIAGTLSTLALARLHSNDPAAATEAESEALQLFGELGNRIGEAIGREHLGRIALFEAELDRARAELGRALAIAQEIAHHEIEAASELLLGEVAFAAGDLTEAETMFCDSLKVCREAGDRRGEANAQHWLGRADLGRGELSSARQRLGIALCAFEEFEMREELVACLEDHAALALLEGRPEDAAQLAGAAAQARVRLALVRSPREDARWRTFVDRVRSAVPGELFDPAWQQGENLETKDAVRAALAHQGAAVTT